MTYHGKVKQGVVVLAEGAKLPEGTVVAVRPVTPKKRRKARRCGPTPLGAALLEFAGCVEGLPSDLARNHDHYLHGAPQEMTTRFADTFYFLALLNKDDDAHAPATALSETYGGRLVTTDWVLAELADALAQPRTRQRCAALIRMLRARRDVAIVRATALLFDRGFELYERRKDKGWTLTDCVSFVVMKDRGIRDALTADRHFEQAGFVALLK